VFVSDSHNVVFIHIQKTGGITVDRLLKERIPDLRGIVARHGFARQGMDELDDWDAYFKFAFVRNPWDRLVSWYSMVTNLPRAGNELWQYVNDNSSTFEEFIYNCTDEVEIKEGVHYSFAYNQLDYVTDEHGNLLVDFIGRLENFDEDLKEVFRRMGFELETVPHKNRSSHRHYSTFYTPETEMIVRERFKRDIEYFGYEFARSPTTLAAGPTEKVSVGPKQRAQKKVNVGDTGVSTVTRAQIRVGRTPKDESPRRTGLLIVCGCDQSGTTVLADYLNRHPEILIHKEGFETLRQGSTSADLPTFVRKLDFGPEETEDSVSNSRAPRDASCG
jgi:chondroitin 4-sulfotransferase 11